TKSRPCSTDPPRVDVLLSCRWPRCPLPGPQASAGSPHGTGIIGNFAPRVNDFHNCTLPAGVAPGECASSARSSRRFARRHKTREHTEIAEDEVAVRIVPGTDLLDIGEADAELLR